MTQTAGRYPILVDPSLLFLRHRDPLAVSGTTYYHNVVIAIDSLGRGAKATGAAGLKIVGFYDGETFTAVSTDRVSVSTGVIPMLNSSTDPVTIADLKNVVYLEGDDTIARTSAGGTLSPCGILELYEDSTPKVQIGAIVPSVALATDLTFNASPRPVRGIVMNNVASLAAFTTTGNAYNDGLTYVAGDRVLLVGQSTPAQNGVYVVGTVASSAASLTRAVDMPTGARYVNGSVVEVSEGTIWRGSSWKVMGTGALVVGTDNPAYYPRNWRKTVTLSSGTYATVTATDGVFLYSTTTSSVQATRNTAGGTLTSTTHYYCPVAGRTAGIAGTGQVTVTASVAAGTVNTADTSTVDLQITNW